MSKNEQVHTVSTEINGQKLEIRTGGFAMQASGACFVQYGETVVLATAVVAPKAKDGIDWLPLTIEYQEKLYAAGKISGSRFIKREGRPSDEAILAARLIDRSLRPLFPKYFYNDIQVIITILSVDGENDPDIPAIVGASAALAISKAPFEGPIGAFRVGRQKNEFVLNPTYSQRDESDLDLVVSGRKDAIVMLEAGANEVKEEDTIEGIRFANENLEKLIALQDELVAKVGVKKMEVTHPEEDKAVLDVKNKLRGFVNEEKLTTYLYQDKLDRDNSTAELYKEINEFIKENFDEASRAMAKDQAGKVVEEESKNLVRKNILENNKRTDGRKSDELRKISADTELLPRTHGSGLFNRGYTQVLTIATLGSSSVEQTFDGIEPVTSKSYMHHYAFPPYSVGEASPMRGVSRREIGHGALAERALLPVIPSKEDFPYTIRLVSEVLSSDGSTSMGSTCGSTLALMDAGVPIKAPVAGISVGLVRENDKTVMLTDIAGIEDFYGDMDFKVTGTNEGVTAIQMDLKLKGLDVKILGEAILRARDMRYVILDIMKERIAEPRKTLSKYAPKIESFKINPEKIRDVIGAGGKVINKIIAETGVEINIEEDGTVAVSSVDADGMKKAIDWIKNLTREVMVGEIFEGKVVRIMNFGAFVEILPGKDGMVHVSELDDKRVENVEDVVKEGDVVTVKVIEIDKMGRINLSMKQAK